MNPWMEAFLVYIGTVAVIRLLLRFVIDPMIDEWQNSDDEE